jgi:ketosteroid isomerase-like protein
MERGTAESVVEAFVACINSRDLEGIAALTAPRYTFTDMEGDVYVFEGDEAVEASWDEYLSAYPDYRISVEHVMRSGDGVAIVGRTTGSHLPAEVERDEVVLWTAELEDGLISEWRIYSTLMCETA